MRGIGDEYAQVRWFRGNEVWTRKEENYWSYLEKDIEEGAARQEEEEAPKMFMDGVRENEKLKRTGGDEN